MNPEYKEGFEEVDVILNDYLGEPHEFTIGYEFTDYYEGGFMQVNCIHDEHIPSYINRDMSIIHYAIKENHHFKDVRF